LAAFGGVYPWIAVPLGAGCLALSLLACPARDETTRVLDAAVGAALIVCGLQLLPLPGSLVDKLSPARVSIADTLQLDAPSSWLTLSISPAETIYAGLVFLGAALVYWSTRRVLERGGTRQVCRAIGWMGLALACVAIAQRGAFKGRIYGFWMPLDTGALPYGPFVNRNHAATWLVMSIPVCFGYLMARLRGDDRPSGRGARSLRQTFDGRTVWLAVAGTTMVLALALSLSRSGITAFVLSTIVATIAARTRMDPVKTAWAAGVIAAGAVAVATLADVAAIVNRFSEGLGTDRLGRVGIWRDTLPMVRDFWLTGSGVGTYQTAMLIYQTGDRAYYFNQAHNHFLQVAAEGGVLLTLPVAVALWGLVSAARRRLHADAPGVFWIRAGAATGLLGAVLQSVWETGLQIPANAILAAVLAAILTHQRRVPAPAARGSAWR
jgi:putative inorganic carbon (HCO3(-)) transporter